MDTKLDDDLFKAVQNGDMEQVKVLIEDGANVNARANDGWTALLIAMDKEYMDIAEELINARADVNAKENSCGLTVLMHAVASGDLAILRKIIKAGANLDAKGKWGWNALMVASGRGGNIDIVRELIKAGVDVNAKTKLFGGDTALMIAQVEGNEEIGETLIQSGALR